MTQPKRLILFVEWPGDAAAIPALVSRIVTELDGWDALNLDTQPFQVGSIKNLLGDKQEKNWLNRLKAAGKRKNTGGILLFLDGDEKL